MAIVLCTWWRLTWKIYGFQRTKPSRGGLFTQNDCAIVSAVGHETRFYITIFRCRRRSRHTNRRAKNYSARCKQLLFDKIEHKTMVRRMSRILRTRSAKQLFDFIESSSFAIPKERIEQHHKRIDQTKTPALQKACAKSLEKQTQKQIWHIPSGRNSQLERNR